MSISNQPKPRGTLKIVAQNDLTEIHVYDALFQGVELPSGNLGEVQIDLDEGIYQAAFRDEKCWEKSQSVLLLAGQLVEIRQNLGSHAPTVKTANWFTTGSSVQTPEPPQQILSGSLWSARTLSAEPPSSFSSSPRQNRSRSELFAAETISGSAVLSNWEVLQELDHATTNVTVMYGRTRRPSSTAPTSSSAAPTPGALTVVGRDGNEIDPLVVMPGEVDSVGFAVPPGNWIVRLKTGLRGLELEMPLFVANGWRTQIVCPGCEYERGVTQPDLAKAIVRLAPAEGDADLHDEELKKLRHTESNALELLATSRALHGRQLQNLIRELTRRKLFNPMLGLYAGYLVANSDDVESADLLDSLIRHLKELLQRGPQRSLPETGDLPPDIQVLEARLRQIRGQSLEVMSFQDAPLLRAGWEIICKASVTAPGLVAAGSLLDAISGNLWGPSAWMLWKRPPESTSVASPRSLAPSLAPQSTHSESKLAVAERALLTDVAVVAAALRHGPLRIWFRSRERSGAEEAVAQAIFPIGCDESEQTISQAIALSAGLGSTSPWTLQRLSQSAHLPAGTAQRALSRLADQFLVYSRELGLNLQERSTMSRPSVIIPYDPDFLGDGFSVSLPMLRPILQPLAYARGTVLDYTHYSLVMQAARRVAIFTAHNVDASRLVRVSGGLSWKMDERAGEYQLGPEVYADNQLDRGHLVRRADVLWGSVSEAREANKSTFFYTNAAPQHRNFNQDEWVSLEDWVLEEATEFSYRLCVFTGPVLRDDDPVLTDLPPDLRMAFRAQGPAQIPAAFWKILVLRDAQAGGDDLSAVAFTMKQSEMWNDNDGSRLLNLKVHQVTISAIEQWTGLDFGSLRNVDELQWSEGHLRAAPEAAPPWPVVRGKSDITYSGISRRALGARARRTTAKDSASSAAMELRGALRTASGDCGCGSGAAFDAAAATAALNQRFVMLTEHMANLQSEAAGAGLRAAPAAPPAGRALDETAEARIQAAADKAPEPLRPRVAEAMRQIVFQAELSKGKIPAPTASEFKRIVGGDLVPPGGFPSCCCIGDPQGWFCTGVLLAPQVVLTAAHCGATISRVMVGGNQVTPSFDAGARVVAVRRVVIHPQYRGFPFSENDINVLILDAPAMMAPTPLAGPDQLRAATQVQLVGFGYNDPSLPLGFGTKRQVVAPLLPMRLTTNDDLGDLPTELGFHADYEFVAGRKGLGKDSCNGDSGGPAFISIDGQTYVAGLTSRATRAAQVNCGDGGIYVRPDSFREWIREVAQAGGVSLFG